MICRSFLSLAALALAVSLSGTSAVAQSDPVKELASFSVFDKVDLTQLARGEARAVRGAPMNTPRYLSVQTVWVGPGTPAQQMQALRQWNPSRHGELRVHLHATGSNFGRLAQAPANPAVQWLATATGTQSKELQLSRAEAAKLPAGATAWAGPVANFWTGVLSARASAGPFAQPPYDHTGQSISPREEINGMLRQQGKIQKQFSGLIGGGGEKFWELLEVESKGVLTLGASFSRSGAGGTQQAADVLYYASSGYYAAITFYQMWPVQVDGKPSTLIWRGDMTSSAAVADLRGVERMGSESAMMRDISRAVRFFRRDSSGMR
ncbi:hypothetical protein BH20VER2_BH20VER2_15780 [soil metagenome]